MVGGGPGLSLAQAVPLSPFPRLTEFCCPRPLGTPRQNLSFEERYVLADRLKAKGNELFKKQKFKFAKARWACLA